jgi:hypothetical protein
VVATILLSRRIILLGIASWLVPFVAAFPFFSRTGELVVPQPLFKSLMVVIGGGVGVLLLAAAFRRVTPTLASGVVIGCYWLVLNLVLDLAILVPMSGRGIGDYLMDIGLRYLLLPIISAGMGWVAQRELARDKL